MSIGNLPESLSQAMLVGTMLEGGSGVAVNIVALNMGIYFIYCYNIYGITYCAYSLNIIIIIIIIIIITIIHADIGRT